MMRRMQMGLAAGLAIVTAAACRSRPVSVVMPENTRDASDLAPISSKGDTAWRTSALMDVQTHSHGPQAVLVEPPKIVTTTRSAADSTRKPSASRVGFNAISAESVNDDPAPSDFDADEGPTILRAQVLLDRAHFSSGVLNGKAGQNTAKAVMFFQEENGLHASGKLDAATYDKIVDIAGKVDGVVKYTLTDDDISRTVFLDPCQRLRAGRSSLRVLRVRARDAR